MSVVSTSDYVCLGLGGDKDAIRYHERAVSGSCMPLLSQNLGSLVN